jgi:hypothetical protein
MTRCRVDRGNGENKAESVFTIEVEPEETFLANESEGFIKRQSSLVVIFCLEDDLSNQERAILT